LDTFGEESLLGKSIGGDIKENKKTALFHLSLLNANDKQHKELLKLYNSSETENKIIKVTKLFKETKADKETLKLVEDYTNLALKSINSLSIPDENKQVFIDFSNSLLERKL
jgi:geranylgeranyl diphosphate synthase type II